MDPPATIIEVPVSRNDIKELPSRSSSIVDIYKKKFDVHTEQPKNPSASSYYSSKVTTAGPSEAMQSQAPSNTNRPENKRCCVCLSEESTIVIIPCGHLCLCNLCGDKFLDNRDKCPICRVKVSSKLRVY